MSVGMGGENGASRLKVSERKNVPAFEKNKRKHTRKKKALMYTLLLFCLLFVD
jgi:hypothetical protein